MNERRTKIALERMRGSEEIVFRVESRLWMKTRATVLRIDARGLEAKGDLGGYRSGTLRLPWEKISELHYGPAGRGAINGLYAREGEWCSRCVLPRVSEAQADEVVAAIAERYPRMAKSPASALETAIGEVLTRKALIQRGWPPLGRRGVAVSASFGRV